MIDENATQIPCWLIWARTTNGLNTLSAIALTQWRADLYRKHIAEQKEVVRVYVDGTFANHIYQPLWDSEWERSYGEKYLSLYAKQVMDIHEVSNARAVKQLSKSVDALRSVIIEILGEDVVDCNDEELIALLKTRVETHMITEDVFNS